MRAALRKPIKSSLELHQVIARFEDDVAEAARDAKRQRMDDEDDITLRFEENQFSHSDLVALAASALGRHLQHLHVCPKYEDVNTHILDFDGLCFPLLKSLELDSPAICALNFRGSVLPVLQSFRGYPSVFDESIRRARHAAAFDRMMLTELDDDAFGRMFTESDDDDRPLRHVRQATP